MEDVGLEQTDVARDAGTDRVHRRAVDPVLADGTRVGNFRVRRLLGEGAMGEVYLAQDLTLGRRVALKLIKRDVMQGDGVARFLEEARATAGFSHPHIVTLHAFGEHEGRPFLALEYLDGETLRARIASGPLTEREALRVMRAAAEAIAEAHEHGVVHADLKPENVVIPRDGRVRIVDFGLARLVGTTRETASGTPAYMAPERWQRSPPTGAIDVWALGVMLCELITRSRPFSDAQLSALAYASAPIATPALPGPWGQLVRECLAMDPVARPPAAEVARRLAAMLDVTAAGTEDSRGPFPGLAAFSRDDAALYFGRQAELDALVETLRTRPLVPIAGPSGAGKSSFVHAALLPRLEEERRWTVVSCRPGSTPFENLARALSAGRESELASLRERPETLSLALGETATSRSSRVLVFVDQFEETFTLAPDQALAFCECLALSAVEDEPWRIVLTVRDSYLARIADSIAMRPHLGAVTILAPMNQADLRAAVVGPLARSGYEPDTVDLAARIASDVAGQPACLPLLQFTCRALWERRDAATRTIVTREYERMGGASGALASHAQRFMTQLSPEQVRMARAILLRLVNPDGTRRPRQRPDLLEGLPAEVVAVLERLLEWRLVVLSRETDGDEAVVELAHEALAIAWPQLARWLDETHEERLLLSEIEQASLLWLRRGQRSEETWTGPALGEAMRRISEWNVALPTASRQFLDAGIRRHRRVRRRRRWLLGATVGGLAAAAVAAVLAAVAFARKEAEAIRQQSLIRLAAADMGAFELAIEPFDWDADSHRARPAGLRPPLEWSFHRVDPADAQAPGETYRTEDVRRGTPRWESGILVEEVQARSGPAFLEVSGRGGDCGSSWIFLQRLPGYTERSTAGPRRLAIHVPTCQASRAGLIEISDGEFVRNAEREDQPGGVEETASFDELHDEPPFAIDRTEVTRAAFAMYGQMASLTGDAAAPSDFLDPGRQGGEQLPIVGVNYFTARNYCHFMSKELPTIAQWQMAFRGGIMVNGAPNPAPWRLTPWIEASSDRPANLARPDGTGDIALVGSHPDDVSPYGVADLAGNVSEWSLSPAVPAALRGLRTVMGANWDTAPGAREHQIDWRNSRPDKYLDFVIGLRCVSSPWW